MEFEQDWLSNQIERASREVGLWPIYKQEYMSGNIFTEEDKKEKLKRRIQLLKDEVEREEANLRILMENNR